MNNAFPPLKNDLLLRALRGEDLSRPPVWMMRQAGRYLPQYQKLREQYSFFERVETPELAAEITLQPVEILGVDAAILFSDILVVPQALDFEVTLNEGEGPRLPRPVQSVADVKRLQMPDVRDCLSYVMEAISLTRRELDGKVPLIGFSGAPWTLYCYMLEGKGSKEFAKAKAFLYREPDAAHQLLQTLTDTIIAYLNAQISAGAQVVQLFDSWGGLLTSEDFASVSLPYIRQIVEQVNGAPIIVFAKGAWSSLAALRDTGADALGIDWNIPAAFAREQLGPDITLQGNLDPSHLLMPIDALQKATWAMINAFYVKHYIANLGHGILPHIPVDHAKAFVEAVQSYNGGGRTG